MKEDSEDEQSCALAKQRTDMSNTLLFSLVTDPILIWTKASTIYYYYNNTWMEKSKILENIKILINNSPPGYRMSNKPRKCPCSPLCIFANSSKFVKKYA